MEEFRKILSEAQRRGVNFQICALDEVHCVSEWGHDFRVAYLNIAETCRRFFRQKEKNPIILALTGTASDNVLRWLLEEVIPKDFGQGSARDLMRIQGKDTKAGIVFCVYKSGKTEFGIDTVFEELNKAGYPGVGIMRQMRRKVP